MNAEQVHALSLERSAVELVRIGERVERTGGCERPIRLSAAGIDSPSRGEPEGVLLIACKSRRESRCLPCSIRYRGDAREIVRSGMEGGKGVPESVTTHPAVFVTLTAPGFGAVHRAGERCRLGPPGRCAHGRRSYCLSAHEEGDELVGTPLCMECYDHEAAVVFNATAGELWRRVTIYAKRHLAYLLHTRPDDLGVRLSYVKVAELQKRGVVHLHAVVRADGIGDEVVPPPSGITPGLLTEALVTAVRAVQVMRELAGRSFTCSFGEQLVVEPLDLERSGKLAGYLAKYLVKEASGTGALDHRLREGELELLDLPDHLRTIVATAWRLGEENASIRRFAHALGFTGHVMTKSHRYSTTFIRLRAIRQTWRIEQREEQETPAGSHLSWSFLGVGWSKEIDAVLAWTYARGRMRERAEYWSVVHEEAGAA